jgi:xylulokinase
VPAPSDLLAAVDLGTSSAKAGLFDLGGREVATAWVEYDASFPAPAWCEERGEDWWAAAATAIRAAIEASSAAASRIAAVSVSGQAPSCLPLDSRGEPLRPAIIWSDRRAAAAQTAFIAEQVGLEAAERVSGNRVDGFFAGSKWLWFQHNEPELFARTWKLVQANGYVTFRLTGEVTTDDSQAGLCAPFYDLAGRRWSGDMLHALGIPEALLPAIVPPTQVIGRVTAEAAAATGLTAGTPVVAGGGDYACSALGAGVTRPGQLVQMLGTAGNLMGPVARGLAADSRLVNTVHLTGDGLVAGTIYAGGVLQWFRNTLGQPEVAAASEAGTSAYALLDEAAASVPPGAEGLLFLPYLMGERTPLWDPDARGMVVGLTPYHTRAHLYRAALEGVAFAMRTILDVIEDGGQSVTDIISVDGGGRSDVWRQIFADVLRARIHRRAGRSATLLGNVALAGVGVGAFPDLTVVKEWQEIVSVADPDPARSAHYLAMHTLHRRFYEQTKDLYPELVRLGRTAPSPTGETPAAAQAGHG